MTVGDAGFNPAEEAKKLASRQRVISQNNEYNKTVLVNLCNMLSVRGNWNGSKPYIYKDMLSQVLWDIGCTVMNKDLCNQLWQFAHQLDKSGAQDYQLLKPWAADPNEKAAKIKALDDFINICFPAVPYHQKHPVIANVFLIACWTPENAIKLHKESYRLSNTPYPFEEQARGVLGQ